METGEGRICVEKEDGGEGRGEAEEREERRRGELERTTRMAEENWRRRRHGRGTMEAGRQQWGKHNGDKGKGKRRRMGKEGNWWNPPPHRRVGVVETETAPCMDVFFDNTRQQNAHSYFCLRIRAERRRNLLTKGPLALFRTSAPFPSRPSSVYVCPFLCVNPRLGYHWACLLVQLLSEQKTS